MKIFISYRRDDSAGYAGRLFDFLSAHFGTENIFMDIDTIEPGQDFRNIVKNAVGQCDVVLVIIGKQWSNIMDAQGRRRLDDPRDWVRLEITSALANPKVLVIPVLVRGAIMPGDHELPGGLKELSWRNAIELSDTRFQYDTQKLIQVIERIPGISAGVQTSGPRKSSGAKYWSVGLGVVGIGVIIAVIGFLFSVMGALNTPTPTVMVTSTNLPTSNPLESTPTQIFAPTEDIPTPTPTPENTSTSTPVVVPPASDAVIYYYAQVSADNFETTWSLLSDHYKATVNSTGFIPYRDYWASVDKVIVNNLSTVYDDGKTATIIADLVYYYHDGRVISIDQSEFGMIYDTQRQTWLINATP